MTMFFLTAVYAARALPRDGQSCRIKESHYGDIVAGVNPPAKGKLT